jgi:TonB family protein
MRWLLILCAACGGSSDRPPSPPGEVGAAPPAVRDLLIVPGTRVGPIDRTTTRQRLAALFPAEALDPSPCSIEGDQIPCTRVAIEGGAGLVVYWGQKGAATSVDVLSPALATAEGVKIGLSLSELVAKNSGTAITFAGFDWDYGGMVHDLGGGPIDQAGLGVWLAYDRGVQPELVAPLIGDRHFRSDDPAVTALTIRVARLTVALTAPGLDPEKVAELVRSRHLAGIARCHKQLLKKDPTVQGRVTLGFTIGPAGTVTRASVAGFHPDVDRCIHELVLTWRFHPPRDEDGAPASADFRLPLNLVAD